MSADTWGRGPAPRPPSARAAWPTRVVLGAAAAAAAAYLFVVHDEHALAWLPIVLLLACPLMHVFHRHGEHDHRREDRNDASGSR